MDEIMDALDWLIDDLDAIPRAGFRAYRSYSPEHLIEHDARAAAACTYCHMVAEADRRWIGRDGIVPIDVRGLKVWVIRDMAVIRWKKMDEDGRSRNYPTKQAKDYDRGCALPGLPPPAVRLSVGYWLDPTQTEIIRVQVAKPRGREIEWCAAVHPNRTGRRWEDITRQYGFGR